MKLHAPIAALLLLLTVAASAEKYAVIVGVDTYSGVTDQLKAPTNDVDLMGKLLKLYGFNHIKPLKSAESTDKAIREAVTRYSALAKSGDEFVFYFSGRGSLLPGLDNPKDLNSFEPTLVAYGGSAKETSSDIRISYLEKVSTELKAKSVHFTAIIDACFTSSTGTRSLFAGYYRPSPKYLTRANQGRPRTQLYRGEGVLLCAAAPTGQCYEWTGLDNPLNPWISAFTSVLCDEASAAIDRHQGLLNYGDLLRRVQSEFIPLVSQSYMPGAIPYPLPAQMTSSGQDGYEVPLFALSKAPPGGSAALQQQRRARRSRLRVLVAFDYDLAIETNPGKLQKESDDLVPKTRAALKAAIALQKDVKIDCIEPTQDIPDVILYTGLAPDGRFCLRIKGDEDDARRFSGDPKFQSDKLELAISDSLAQYIVPQSYMVRLFQLFDDGSPSLPADCSFNLSSKVALPRQEVSLALKAPFDGKLVLFDQDLNDGLVHMIFPRVESDSTVKWNSYGPVHASQDQHVRLGAVDGTQGAVRVRGLFISGVLLPDVHDGDNVQAMTDYLAALCAGIEGGTIKWRAEEATCTVKADSTEPQASLARRIGKS